MLLIWDIHLNSRIKDKLLSSLKSFIQEHNEEKDLVFLWDFVYHFSYDRNALLELYDLFLELYTQGKNLYILAWNHDRLGNTFVFEEWRKAFEILSRMKNSDNEICFITKPFVKEIEWKNICFLPAMLEIDEKDFPWIDDLKDQKYAEEMKSKNKNLTFSTQLNLVVERFTKKYSDLNLIHHYYVEWVSFPWQKAKFSFRDRALSQHWLDQENLQIISWHLHQAFAYKNYLCTWSLRATSPLEIDQIKYFWIWNDGKFAAHETGINYYFTMERKTGNADLFTQSFQAISENDIISHWKSLQNSDNFRGASFTVEANYKDSLDMKNVSLSLSVEKLQYDNMDEFVEPKLQQSLQNVQLKKDTKSTEKLLEQLEKPDLAGQLSFWNWLELLKKFLKKQYPDDYEDYEKLLQEMKIL